MKLLCTGDLHIGRRPSHTPSYLDERPCSCAAAWEALVDGAITEKVDAILISGDVVDRNNRFYEAFGPLERGLKRLAQAEIETFAVAGNHDYDVLPRLVDTVGPERFHLVGRGGKWEKVTLWRNGGTLLEVHGWSFPHEYVSYNPLQTYNLSRDDNIPTLGLLHADLDQPASRYAPVSLADLQRRPVDLWHLGHVHRPCFYEQNGTQLIFYPGCPQAMDPGETGLHGVWLIHWDGGRPSYRAMPLAAVRYETISVDLNGVEQESEIEPLIIRVLKAHLAQISAESGPRMECLCCRLRLTGRTRLHRRLPQLCAPLLEETWEIREGAVRVYVEKLLNETRPAYDLHDLARGNDPPGVLARLLLSLDCGTSDEKYDVLLQRARNAMAAVYAQKEYGGLSADGEPDAEAARTQLLRQGYLLLDTLLTQKEFL